MLEQDRNEANQGDKKYQSQGRGARFSWSCRPLGAAHPERGKLSSGPLQEQWRLGASLQPQDLLSWLTSHFRWSVNCNENICIHWDFNTVCALRSRCLGSGRCSYFVIHQSKERKGRVSCEQSEVVWCSFILEYTERRLKPTQSVRKLRKNVNQNNCDL